MHCAILSNNIDINLQTKRYRTYRTYRTLRLLGHFEQLKYTTTSSQDHAATILQVQTQIIPSIPQFHDSTGCNKPQANESVRACEWVGVNQQEVRHVHSLVARRWW